MQISTGNAVIIRGIINPMDEQERDQIVESLYKTERKIRSFKFGLVFFALAYIAAAFVFAYIYYSNRKIESLVMTIVMVMLTAASIHGYHQRLAQLRDEKRSLEEKLEKLEKGNS